MVSDGGLDFNHLDSRFRGNDGEKAGMDGGRMGVGGFDARGSRLVSGGWIVRRPRVFVRIRIYGIGGIFRISFRLDYAFRITENHAKTNMDGRLPVEGARWENPENPIIQ